MAIGRGFCRGQAVNDETVSTLDQFAAPYGRQVTLDSVEHESGLRMLRIHIREGRRFTVMDIDADKNRLIVGVKKNLFSKGLIASNLNFLAVESLDRSY